jgi:hypothetical protein
MHRTVRLVALAILLGSSSGCRAWRWIKDHCRPNVQANAGVVHVGVDCHAGPDETIGEGSDRLATAVNAVREAIGRGSAAAFDECVSFGFCSGPDDQSDDCDTCRNTSANAVITPSLVACRGTSYGPAPDSISGGLEADTDLGHISSPFTVTFRRLPSTPVTFSECSTATIEYVIDDADRRLVQDWMQQYIDRGLHSMPTFSLVSRGTGAENEDLLGLADAAGSCVGSTDAATCGLWVGGFLFGREVAQPAHGAVTPNALLPSNPSGLTGGYSFQGPADFVQHP